MHPTDADRALPFHLCGNYRPVTDELTEYELAVEGSIPDQLDGWYIRNGANPRSGHSAHWLFGDGMLHAIEIAHGRAVSYRNRWVRTRLFDDPHMPLLTGSGMRDLTATWANAHVIAHAGRILALGDSGYPIEVTTDLTTIGPYDFRGRLRTPMAAHPKICPLTGEMHFFGASVQPPYLVYHRISAAGEIIQSDPIAVPRPIFMHDIALTERHVLFLDLPLVFDPERHRRQLFPFHWNRSHGARIGIIPRGETTSVRWFDIEPCFVFHILNAYHNTEDGMDRVVLDAARHDALIDETGANPSDAFLHRWVFDLPTGDVVEQRLDTRPIELVRIDERRTGLPYRYGYALERSPGSRVRFAILQYDLETGGAGRHMFPAGHMPDEPIFVPAARTSAENQGWVLSIVYDSHQQRSYLAILDVQAFEGPPIAIIHLPRRVPFGFHGSWIARQVEMSSTLC